MNKLTRRIIWLHLRTALGCASVISGAIAVCFAYYSVDWFLHKRFRVSWSDLLIIDFVFTMGTIMLCAIFADTIRDYFYVIEEQAERQIKAEEVSSKEKDILLRGADVKK